MNKATSDKEVVIVGAGPAGLTAAYELSKFDVCPTVLEKANIVGGLARTESLFQKKVQTFMTTADTDPKVRRKKNRYMKSRRATGTTLTGSPTFVPMSPIES
jgi:ribulose 1,5-bisphosphate synthetase/thiazole synthase